MVNYVIKIIKPILREEAEYAEVKKTALEKWQNGIQSDMKNTVFVGCTSWYMDKEGFISTMYP